MWKSILRLRRGIEDVNNVSYDKTSNLSLQRSNRQKREDQRVNRKEYDDNINASLLSVFETDSN